MFRASISPSSGVFPAVATCCHLVPIYSIDILNKIMLKYGFKIILYSTSINVYMD